ncbi:hypothetical protein HW115_02305 [Verrucomicrobiaceae bacterium N1E253]|uniref:Uncharacterized protein n=1 Tax=Oceaniferula marina TaxID=2748318 RepID=A0A851GAJ8_9BACT|nr:hypothetical protein [Oceaniferula marina]NWK54426.1 hypothetical protein [Oceaniferula marina]
MSCTFAAAETNNHSANTPKKRPSHEDILDKQAKSPRPVPTTNSAPAQSEKIHTPQKNKPLSRSTILSHANKWTKIPQGSIMYTPDHLKKNIVATPTGKILSWNDFYRKNAGWIHLHPVTINQARGLTVIKADIIKAYQSMGKVVVATYHKAPISVMPKALEPETLKQ